MGQYGYGSFPLSPITGRDEGLLNVWLFQEVSAKQQCLKKKKKPVAQ